MYKHYEINTKVKKVTTKSALVVMDGVEKYLAFKKIKSFCFEELGDLSTQEFQDFYDETGLPEHKMLSVEMDTWLADIHDLVSIDE